jgi:hypothetical protein
VRRRLAQWLRSWADRIDHTSAPRLMSGHSFTYERGKGLVFRTDRRGAPLWYMTHEHHLAHDEADTEHPAILWKNLADGRPPFTRRAGGGGVPQ